MTIELRARLRSQLSAASPTQPVLGTFIKLGGGESLDVLTQCGVDVVVIDGEHSSLSDSEILALIDRATRHGLPSLVRVATVDGAWVARLLDAGATGIQLAGVEDRTTVDALIAATRIAPDGVRGVSLATPAAGYGATSLTDFVARERSTPPVVVVQLESAEALNNIASLSIGTDAAFIGTTDLAVSAALTAPELEALTATAVHNAAPGVTVGGFVNAARSGIGVGSFSYLVVESDLALLASFLRTTFPLRSTS